MYYRGASAAILVYDICNAASFETLPTWLQRLKEFGPPKDKKNDTFIIIIVGNKCDLDNERQVMRESAERFASQQGCLYMESSAREDIRVEAIFQRIAKLLPEDTISCFDISGNGARNSKNGSSSNDNDGIFKLSVQPPQQGPNTFSSIRHGVCGC